MHSTNNIFLLFGITILFNQYQFSLSILSKGDDMAKPGDVPWQLYLKVNEHFRCGATLILVHNRVAGVLTTASCVTKDSGSGFENPEDLVVVGDTCIFNGRPNHDFGQVRKVTKIVVHEDWDPVTYQNDIAILFLDKEFEYKQAVHSIVFPDQVYDAWSPGEMTISGWGARGDSAQVGFQLKFKEIRLRGKTQEWCNSLATGGMTITDKQFCITAFNDEGVGTCKADRGGPVGFYVRGTGWRLGGLISYQRNFACDWEEPTIIVKISAYLDWVKNHIE